MEDSLLRIPVVCPDCGTESLVELRAARLTEALVTGGSIHLHAACHGRVWQASGIEREQLRQYLGALSFP